MSPGTIVTKAKRPSSDFILGVLAEATARKKLREGLSQQALAEKFGKSDKKSAAAYLAAEADMGMVGFINAAHEDEQFADDVIRALLGRKLCPIDVEDQVDHGQTARLASQFLTVLLEELDHDDDGDGDPLDRAGVLALDALLSKLEPKMAAIRTRAAKIRQRGGR